MATSHVNECWKIHQHTWISIFTNALDDSPRFGLRLCRLEMKEGKKFVPFLMMASTWCLKRTHWLVGGWDVEVDPTSKFCNKNRQVQIRIWSLFWEMISRFGGETCPSLQMLMCRTTILEKIAFNIYLIFKCSSRAISSDEDIHISVTYIFECIWGFLQSNCGVS